VAPGLEVERDYPPGETGPPAEGALTTGVARGGLWSVGGQLAGLVAALFLTPFTIRLLGPARYGFWALLQTALGWVGIADFGMSTGSTRIAGERYAKHDGQGEATAVWTAAAITVLFTAVVAGAASAAAPFVVKTLLHVNGQLVGPATTAVRLTAAGCVAAVIMGTTNTPLLLRQHWRSFTLINSGSAVLQVVAIPLLLELAGGGVITAAIVSLATSLLGAAGMIYVAVRLQPRMSRPRLQAKVARSLLAFGGALTIAGIASIVLTSAERLLLAHNRSTVEVAYYAVAMRLGTLLWVVPTAIAQPLFPALVTLHAKGDMDGARLLYRQALQGTYLVLTPLLLVLAFVAHPFLTLWAGPAYGEHSTHPLLVILAGVWFNSIAWLPATYLTAAVRPSFIAKIELAQVIPYVAAAAILTARFGVMGAAIVWSARVAIDAVVFSWTARRMTGVTASPLSSRAARSLVAPMLLGAALLLVSHATSGLAERAVCGAVLAALYGFIAWRTVLSDRERAGMRSLAGTLAPVRRRAARSEPPAPG